MSEFRFGYESQNHKIEIQIPVCLLGKPDPDAFTGFANLIGKNENTVEPDEANKNDRSGGLFRKKKSENVATKTDHKTMDTIAKTSALLLSSMVLAALKD